PTGPCTTANWTFSHWLTVSTRPPSPSTRRTLSATSATRIGGIHCSGKRSNSACRCPRPMMGIPALFRRSPPPQGLRPRAQHLRVKPHFPLVFGHGDSGVPRQDPCARQRKGCCTLPFPSGKGSLNVAARRHPSRPLWLCKDVHSELLRLTIPTIISTLAVPLLGMVDTAVLGRLPDVNQLAGAAAAGI